jgi:hypothetical protein
MHLILHFFSKYIQDSFTIESKAAEKDHITSTIARGNDEHIIWSIN